MRPKFFRVLTIYLPVLFICFEVKAEPTVDFVFEAGTTNKDIEFLTTDGNTGNPVAFAAKIISLDYAGSVLYGNMYTRLKLSQSIKDDAVFRNDDGSVLFFSRSDLDLTFGYYIGSGVSTFAGYKQGEFDINVNGDGASAGQNVNVVFSDSGYFLGINYSLPLEKSSLSFSFAYALMDGEVVLNFPASATQRTTGETTGLSYSVSWSKPVTDSTSFTAKLNIIRYEFEDEAIGLGLNFNTSQDFDNISVGFSHYFE